MYLIKYPEENHRGDEADEPWSIRQSGLYHQLHLTEDNAVTILISPIEDSVAESVLSRQLLAVSSLSEVGEDPFRASRILLSSYVDGWRSYLRYYDRKIEELASSTSALLSNAALTTLSHSRC
jgi:hypothetical protein